MRIEKRLSNTFKEFAAPNVESDAHYAGYVALEVVAVSHTVDGQGHRPYLFCKHTRAVFGST